MWCLRGRFDPETGLQLHNRLANTVVALFAAKTPADCPFHLLDWQAFLRAHALAAEGAGRLAASPRSSQWSTSAIRSPTGHRPSWGLPVELPAEVLRRLFDTAEVHPVVVRGGLVLHAPASSTWAGPPGWPTGPNAERYAPSTQSGSSRRPRASLHAQ
jgi:hypothetical protein